MSKNRTASSSPAPLLLKYLYGGVVQYRPGDSLAPRVLPDFEIVLMIEGKAIYRLDDRNLQAPPGAVILARPQFRERYQWDPAAPTRHAYVHFDIARMAGDWPPASSWPVLQVNPDPVIAPMLRHLIERIMAHPEWPTLSPGPADCRFLQSIIDILLQPGRSRSSLERRLPVPVHLAFNLMRSVLDEDPHRKLHLPDLAVQAGVTEKHLCRIFQTALGQPPMQTFRLLKLQLAVTLLGRSNLAIKEIADRCGFENPLYFTRCFSQTYGASPSEVRKSLLRQEPPPPSPLPPGIAPRLFW